ncbi:DNA-directed RNA polymerase III subunit RPC7 isoform X5 [Centrocercus urophasianus]|uniref:DNA-directed RNA polymerase III subunit RPC7 isoform X5 n=1 Tax=Centrocercus urophasianus TaxID=9002 RepID=UPI001C645F8E|nr:DNA-directed RNA polymerase III subunit RPC7 isoform X5 [Centrocercus urophasianus]XP_042678770.1 DNA-directed RNA polymerase III subunit RPC7 isoform X5 [Centrocercus urophasianus]XP_042678771.1 DNA-directed RNA polymerase III subunit RPC7 isoform X5 [Centrocercus urophasianus]
MKNDRRVEAGIGPSVPTAAPAGASREDYPGPCPGGFWSCLAWRSEGFRETSEAIERYSKKYMDDEKEHAAWTPDWRRLPREMKPRKKMKKAGAKPKKAKNSEPKSNVDVLKKIEELEKKDDEEEKSDDEKDRTKDKEGEDDEEAEEPEEYDEEEHEEENDYISSYFEDGDDFGAGSDDNMDEATY